MRGYVLATASVFVLTIAGTSPTWAAWGCQARGANNSWGDSYGAQNEDQARLAALNTCQRAANQVCHVTECHTGIDTPDQALARWPAPTKITVGCGPHSGFNRKCDE